MLAAGSSNTTSALQDGQANISNSSLSIMFHSFFSNGYSIYSMYRFSVLQGMVWGTGLSVIVASES
jgi:hypothetical protein